MEMTIEEAHEILSNGLVNASSEHEWCVAFKMAIETMHKYQKIEEIMHKVYTSDNLDVCLVQRLAEIREVIEDG